MAGGQFPLDCDLMAAHDTSGRPRPGPLLKKRCVISRSPRLPPRHREAEAARLKISRAVDIFD